MSRLAQAEARTENAVQSPPETAPPPVGHTTSVLLLLAAIAVAMAIWIDEGNYHPVALLLVAIAGCLAAAALLGIRIALIERHGARGRTAVLTMGLAVQAAAILTRPILPVGGEIDQAAAGLALAGLVVCLLATAMCIPAAWSRVVKTWMRVAAVCGLVLLPFAHIVAGYWALGAAAPPIDVISFQQLAVAELLEGHNPYRMLYEHPTGGPSALYGESLQHDGMQLFGFPYPPLSLITIFPLTVLTTDFRLTQALAFTLTGLLIWLVRRSPTAALAAGLWLVTPVGPIVLVSGWTEPLVAAALAITVWAAVQRPAGTGVGLGLFWSMKQYVPLTAPLAWLLLDRPNRWRTLIIAVITGLLVSLPLAAWDVRAFLHSVAEVQFLQPFRPDALSVLSLIYRTTGRTPPSWIGFIAMGLMQGLALWRAPRTPAGFAMAVAATLLVFFAFNKQAFANYYFLVVAALILAAVASEPEDGMPVANPPRAVRLRTPVRAKGNR